MALSKDFISEKFSRPVVIGVAGVATAGKDTFFALFQEYLGRHGFHVKRFALADKLKDEIDPFLFDKFGISAWTKNPEEKKLIRPMLVSYGGIRRKMSMGKYWTESITPDIQRALEDGIIPVVTDIRYAEYTQDEIFWVKNLGGKLAYISRYMLKDGQKHFVEPPNEDERRNDPRLREAATKIIEWDTVLNPTVDSMSEHIEGFIEKL